MKKQYKLLITISTAEFIILSLFNRNNIKIESWIGNVIGAFIFLLPIQMLLFLLGKDEKFSAKVRVLFKIAFWFITICYLLGGIATLVELLQVG